MWEALCILLIAASAFVVYQVMCEALGRHLKQCRKLRAWRFGRSR